MWSSLNGPFNIAKQNPQRSANELRLFKPRKLGKSFQYLRSASVNRIVVFSRLFGCRMTNG